MMMRLIEYDPAIIAGMVGARLAERDELSPDAQTYPGVNQRHHPHPYAPASMQPRIRYGTNNGTEVHPHYNYTTDPRFFMFLTISHS
jgi:hypothetical protein